MESWNTFLLLCCFPAFLVWPSVQTADALRGGERYRLRGLLLRVYNRANAINSVDACDAFLLHCVSLKQRTSTSLTIWSFEKKQVR